MSVKKQCNHNIILFGSHNHITNVPEENVMVISSIKEMEDILKDLCLEIDKRFRLFSKHKITNIDELNSIEKKPYYTIIIDGTIESKEINYYLEHILNLGRSSGIFLLQMKKNIK